MNSDDTQYDAGNQRNGNGQNAINKNEKWVNNSNKNYEWKFYGHSNMNL
jgi:hypothetical protein